MLNNRIDVIVEQAAFAEVGSLLHRARKAIRLAEYPQAEELLQQAREMMDRDEAVYFNLLGAMHESQNKRRLAKKCYAKANGYSHTYGPARLNLQRSKSGRAFLGDENENIWYAEIPKR